MKKILYFLFALVLVTTIIHGQKQLDNFEQLLESLKKGNEVKVRIHYAKCNLYIKGEKQKSSPNAIGGMTLDVFEYFAPGSIKNEKGFLASSKKSFISLNNDKFVYNYVKIKIYEDSSVEINAKYLEPNSFKVLMNETFKTVINNGKNRGGVWLYE